MRTHTRGAIVLTAAVASFAGGAVAGWVESPTLLFVVVAVCTWVLWLVIEGVLSDG